MALPEFVFGLFVAVIFISKGSQGSSESVCGAHGSPGHWPWQASVTRRGAYVCEGTLISDQWVLTAAQYIRLWGPEIHLVVYLGSTISNTYFDSNVTRAVDVKHCQTSYDLYFPYGVCLLRLSSPVTFGPSVQPVCLAERGSAFHTGAPSWVSGWGSVYNGDYTQYTYYDFNATVVGENECSCHRSSAVPNNTLCAWTGDHTDLRTIGLPLLIQEDSVWVQSGVLTTTCWAYEPCLYSDVSRYQDWIQSVVDTNSSSSSSSSRPGFVTFTSPGEDSDMGFNCSTFDIFSLFSRSSEEAPRFRLTLSLLGLTMLLGT